MMGIYKNFVSRVWAPKWVGSHTNAVYFCKLKRVRERERVSLLAHHNVGKCSFMYYWLVERTDGQSWGRNFLLHEEKNIKTPTVFNDTSKITRFAKFATYNIIITLYKMRYWLRMGK